MILHDDFGSKLFPQKLPDNSPRRRVQALQDNLENQERGIEQFMAVRRCAA